jgi:hypothetical protein
MADIKNQLIKDSYNYVLQSDLSTGIVYRIGGAIPVNPIFLSGLTINSGFTYSNGTEQNGYVLTCDASGNANWGPAGGTTGVYLPLSGGTVSGGTIFQSGLTANTISATTYQNLPTDVYVTGGTYTNGEITFLNNTGGTFTVTGLPIGGPGGQVYYLNLSNSQPPYREFSPSGTTNSQQITAVTINNGVTSTITSFQTPTGYPNASLIPAGYWSFYLHSFKQNSNASFDIFCEVYLRTTGGTETLLVTTDPAPVTTNSPNPSMQLTDGYYSGSSINTTDRIVVKVRATNTSNQSHSITLVTEGTQHYSYGITPFSDNSALTCGTLSGCSIIQTIQTDISNKFDKSGGTINGNLTVTGNTSLQGLTATTISATTYQNLPSSFQSVRISGTTQFSANTGTFINFSGVNISITSASTNTLVFSGSPQFTVPGSNNQVLTSDGSGGAVAESLLTFDGAATSPTLNVNGVRVGRGNFNVCTNISIGGVAFSGVAPGGNNIAIGQQSQTSNLGQGNTSIGYKSLRSKTIGDFNISLGHKSMSSSQSVCYGLNYNISIGYKNMYQACGNNNISMGSSSLYNISQCMFGNIAIGDKSLREGTSISRNIGIGTNSLKKLSTGYCNIGIGDYALYGYGCSISFSRNIALGFKSQKNKCAGDDNISLGVTSLYCNPNGSKNIAIGTNAIRQNSNCLTSGIGNIGIGYDSLRNNTSASDHNIAIGQAALYYNTGAQGPKPDFNVAIGRCSMLNNNNGCENIAIGRRALMSNSGCYSNQGCGNVALGRGTMANNFTGNYNIAIGRSSLYSNTTGVHNIALGRNSGGEITTGSNNISLGYNSLYYTSTGRDNIAIGNQALCYNTDGVRNIAIGYQSLRKSDKKSDNIAIGPNTLHDWVGGESRLSNIAIGLNSLYGGTTNSGAPYYTTNYSKFSGNIAIGQESQSCNYYGNLNVSLGHNTLTFNVYGSENVAIGSGALYRANGGNNNIAIGTKSIGYTGPVPVGNHNIAIGYYSFGRTSCGGSYNILLGLKSMYGSNGGSHNIGLGYCVLFSNYGQSNIALGYKSLYQNTSGYRNIAIGNNTNSGNYNYSIILGGYATATGNNQFVVGSSSIPIGTITTESCSSSRTWEIRINGNSYKVLLA